MISRVLLSVFLVVSLLGLSACAEFQGRPVVTLDMGAASIMYAHGYGYYQVGKYIVTQACKQKKLSQSDCDSAKQIDLAAGVYATEIEKALMNPTAPVDWQKVMEFAQKTMEMVVKYGPLLAP